MEFAFHWFSTTQITNIAKIFCRKRIFNITFGRGLLDVHVRFFHIILKRNRLLRERNEILKTTKETHKSEKEKSRFSQPEPKSKLG